jgi:hypothetical protein
VIWITYVCATAAAVSFAPMTLASVGVFENRELSRGIFSGSAIMTFVYTAISLVTSQVIR